MSDSDGDYVGEDLSDDDLHDHHLSDDGHDGGNARSSKSQGGQKQRRDRKKGGRSMAWEAVKRSWEEVVEGDDGSLTVSERLEAEKRRRLLRDTTPLQRGIIRHLMLVLDMSFAMAQKDLLPTRYRVTWKFAREFVKAYFEQNPISQMAIIGMRDGIAVRISDMSGNPTEHLEQLKKWEDLDPSGNPSLQNALEMCRGALFHAPTHNTREVLIIYGALLSNDPGDIRDTIFNLTVDRIRVTIVGLAAQVAICGEICCKTNAGDESQYNVAIDEVHFRELFLRTTTPPVTRSQAHSTASVIMIGFPSRTLAAADTVVYCACHNLPTREGYTCTRCLTRVCRLPAECPSCGLTLILSTHLARSYHHLFPLRNWIEVPWTEARKSRTCYSCLAPFPESPRPKKDNDIDTGGGTEGPAIVEEDASAETGSSQQSRDEVKSRTTELPGVSESGRYACEVCGNHFCIDCDVFAHEVIHNCPGCQSDIRGQQGMAQAEGSGTIETNGHHTNGTMEVDS